MKHCQWCDKQFKSTVSYQIYCSPECRSEATREKIAEKYEITRRTNRAKKKRFCKSCQIPLSIYNDSIICQSCTINPQDVAKAIKEIKGMANDKNNLHD